MAQLIEQTATASAPDGERVSVFEVVPAPADDPRGGAFSASILPLILLGIAAGALGALVTTRLSLALGFLAAASAAIGATVAALYRLLDAAGITLAAPLFIPIGNPWSGLSSAPELLPPAAAFVGQLLPPGAGGELLRATAFFDGADTTGNLAILLAWIAFGAALPAGAPKLRSAIGGRPPDRR